MPEPERTLPYPASRAATAGRLFSYDYLGRRVKKAVYDYAAGAWTLEQERLFVYDGWNLIEEIKREGGTETSRYFVWGQDLSQSLQGAGGIGGLVAEVDGSGGSSLTYYFCYDGNGNVGQVVNAADGSIAAAYEYDPYGKVLKADGDMAGDNPFRFSTKYWDDETGLGYWGYRYYSSELGRWVSRDPKKEKGGINLYAFCHNLPISFTDPMGLAYFAYRPLDSSAGKLLGIVGSSYDDRLNTVIAHENLFFEDGKTPTNLGFFDDNRVRPDRSSLKYQAPHDTGWNDCLMRKAVANVKPPTYCLLGKPGKIEKFNCQDWADAVRAEYRRLSQIPSSPSGCCLTDAEKNK